MHVVIFGRLAVFCCKDFDIRYYLQFFRQIIFILVMLILGVSDLFHFILLLVTLTLVEITKLENQKSGRFIFLLQWQVYHAKKKKKKKKKKKGKADLTTVLHIRELPHLHMKLAVWFSFPTTNNKNPMIPS